jgi:hypothetical protein
LKWRLGNPSSPHRIVHLGHQRWDIENYGFNELANEWHSDHVFKHDRGATKCFLLVTFLAYNLSRLSGAQCEASRTPG